MSRIKLSQFAVLFALLCCSIQVHAIEVFAPQLFGGSPHTIVHQVNFSAPLLLGYTIIVENGGGGAGTSNRVTAVQITVNGSNVINDSGFHSKAGFSQSVSLAPQNQMSISLHGANLSFVKIKIIGEQALPPVPVMSVNPSSGVVPLTAAFSAVGSYDPNAGSITNYSWMFGDGATASEIISSHTYTQPGTYEAVLTVTNNFGLSASTSMLITVMNDTVAPFITIQSPQSGAELTSLIVPVSGTSNEPLSILTVNGMQIPLSSDGLSFSGIYTSPNDGSQNLAFAATDLWGNTSTTNVSIFIEVPNSTPPEDPAENAPPMEVGENTTPLESLSFLYSGANPVQTGVAQGAIDELHVAGIRGKVLGADGLPIKSVKVTALNHPEFGQTLTRPDGLFDFVFNVDSEITLKFEKEGFFSVQRKTEASMQAFGTLDDIVMLQASPIVTTIAANSTVVQAAQGEAVQDEDGERKGTLLIPANTSAQMVLPNGTVQNLPSLNLRITEFTDGRNSLNRMPAELPPRTGFTYAVEVSADEAIAAKANTVTFNQAVYYYVDNFLNVPPGTMVPSGFYNYETGKWEAQRNGIVIRILSVQDGMAIIDADGSGQPASIERMNLIGYNSDEAQKVADLYEVGKSYWRMPIEHLSPFDFNFPSSPFGEELAPLGPPVPDGDVPCICGPSDIGGSIIDVQSQKLGESVEIAGTPFSLNYQSDRVPGNFSLRSYRIRLTDSTISDSLKQIKLEWKVAGRSFVETIEAQPNLSRTFVWDGLDAFGRTVQSAVKGQAIVTFIFNGAYAYSPYENSFGFSRIFGAGVLTPIDRTNATFTTKFDFDLNAWTPKDFRGWTLSNHHVYDPVGKSLFLGTGETVAGNIMPSKVGPYPVGATFNSIGAIASAPDGTVFFYDSGLGELRRIDAKTGAVTSVIVPPSFQVPYALDIEAIDSKSFLVITRDTLNTSFDAVYKYENDMFARIVGATPEGATSGEGLLAATIFEANIRSVEIDKDGEIYYSTDNRIRHISNGFAQTLVGGGTNPNPTDGSSGLTALLTNPSSLNVDRTGNMYFMDNGSNNQRVWRVNKAGLMNFVGGNGIKSVCLLSDEESFKNAGIHFTDMALDASGNLVLSTNGILISVLPNGATKLLSARTGACGPQLTLSADGDGGPAQEGIVRGSPLIATDTLDNIYFTHIADGISRIRKIGRALPGSGDNFLIAAPSGEELLIFDASGRHLETRTALTGAVKYKFDYNEEGYLVVVHDIDDNLTIINRDSNNDPVSVVSPYGVTTLFSVGPDGYLSSISNQEGDSHFITYFEGGLLKRFIKPNGNGSTMTYTSDGRLTRDEDDRGGFSQLLRTSILDGAQVTLQTSEGLSSNYELTSGLAGGNSFQHSDPSGLITTANESNFSASINTIPDGTTKRVVLRGDPRLGLPVAFRSTFTKTTPGGLNYSEAQFKSVENSDPTNILSFSQLTETKQVGGDATTSIYTSANRTWTHTSQQGRLSFEVLNEKEKPIQTQIGNLTPINFDYDERGRLSTTTQGTRTTTMTYDSRGFIQSITNPKNQTTQLSYDNAGRVLSKTLPDNRVIGYNYDRNGNLAGVIPPGKPQHSLLYDLADLLGVYTPPSIGTANYSTTWNYDLDKRLTSISKPGGLAASYTYEQGTGRLSTITTNDGSQYLRTYDNVGRLSSMSYLGESMEFSYDGDLLVNTLLKSNGVAYGSVGYAYNNKLQVSTHFVNGQPLAMSYDRDGLLTQTGSQSLTYDSNGLLATRTVGGMLMTYGYNEFGELTSFSAMRGAATYLSYTLVRDPNGKIVQKTETEASGTTSVYDYTFDTSGRLTEVRINGVLRQQSEYDANSNRILFRAFDLQGQQIVTYGGTFDDQDRMRHFDGFVYTYNDNGDVASSIASSNSANFSTFSYDVFGNLRRLFLSGLNITFDYIIDAQNRLIGRNRNGVTNLRLLYDGPRVVAELDGNTNLVSRFVYGSNDHSPDYMIRLGILYVYVSDHLGGPRYLVRSTDGAIVQTLNYETVDAFGSNAGGGTPGGTFQPFGFAGGLVLNPGAGIVRFGARDYHAQSGRWTSKDPYMFGNPSGGRDIVDPSLNIGFRGRHPAGVMQPGGVPFGKMSEDVNLYGYAMNDPVNFIDPSGLLVGCYLSAPDLYICAQTKGSMGFRLSLNRMQNCGLFCFLDDYDWEQMQKKTQKPEQNRCEQ